jgi:hypothetical protein
MLGRVWFVPKGEESTLVEFGEWMRSRNHARPTDPSFEAAAKAKEEK